MYFPKSSCCPDLRSLSNATRGDKFWKFLTAVMWYFEGSWMSTDTGLWRLRGRIGNQQHLRGCLCPGLLTLVTRDSIVGGEAGETPPPPTPCSLQPSQTQLRMVSANWGSDDNLRSRSWSWKTLQTVAYEWRKVGLFSWAFSTLFPSVQHVKEHNKVLKYYTYNTIYI